MSTVQHTLAVLAVRDVDEATAWYERLLGTPPTNRPMSTLVEWRVSGDGWLQINQDTKRAGHGMVNFAVDDLAGRLRDMANRGLTPGEVVDVNKGVQLSSLTDPDGNVVTFIGGFRPEY